LDFFLSFFLSPDREQKYGKQSHDSIKVLQEKTKKARLQRERLLEERSKLRLQLQSTRERAATLQTDLHALAEENCLMSECPFFSPFFSLRFLWAQ